MRVYMRTCEHVIASLSVNSKPPENGTNFNSAYYNTFINLVITFQTLFRTVKKEKNVI